MNIHMLRSKLTNLRRLIARVMVRAPEVAAVLKTPDMQIYWVMTLPRMYSHIEEKCRDVPKRLTSITSMVFHNFTCLTTSGSVHMNKGSDKRC